MKKETGGSVFPFRVEESLTKRRDGVSCSISRVEGGITLRDFFAGQAVPGIIAFPGTIHDNPSKSPNLIASLAYEIADAMIAERSKE